MFLILVIRLFASSGGYQAGIVFYDDEETADQPFKKLANANTGDTGTAWTQLLVRIQEGIDRYAA
jgi:hypothetical protein